MYSNTEARKILLDKIPKSQEDMDGPVARAKQLLDSPVFGSVMRDFIHDKYYRTSGNMISEKHIEHRHGNS